MLKHGILGLLNYGPMTGYEINELFSTSLSYFWQAQKSQIYRELNTLEGRGWIARQTVPQEGKPDKNLCFITSAGKDELMAWLASGQSGIEMRAPVLMRVFFLGERTREENIAFFERIVSDCGAYLGQIEQVKPMIAGFGQQLGQPEKALYWGMTVDYGIKSMQMHVEWARECIDILKEER